jgi:DNA-directed RNA polymerase subunit alpha
MIAPAFFTKKTLEGKDYGKFILEPLPQSFGNSLGNALRRTLLSSLKGAAVTQIKVNGAPHLFSTLPGVKESVLDIVLNLKQLRFKTPRDGKFKLTLELKGKKKVYGRDLTGEADVVNGDMYLAEITDPKGKIDLDVIVSTGVGSLSAEEQEKETGYTAVDAYFSPVRKVTFKVDEARVGRKTNFDSLNLDVWTDGTLSATDALKNASAILADHLTHILSGRDVAVSKEKDAGEDVEKKIDHKLKEIIIDELNLPSRVINSLLRENIETVADLVSAGKDKLINVKGLGKKSFFLIEEELRKMGIEI